MRNTTLTFLFDFHFSTDNLYFRQVLLRKHRCLLVVMADYIFRTYETPYFIDCLLFLFWVSKMTTLNNLKVVTNMNGTKWQQYTTMRKVFLKNVQSKVWCLIEQTVMWYSALLLYVIGYISYVICRRKILRQLLRAKTRTSVQLMIKRHHLHFSLATDVTFGATEGSGISVENKTWNYFSQCV